MDQVSTFHYISVEKRGTDLASLHRIHSGACSRHPGQVVHRFLVSLRVQNLNLLFLLKSAWRLTENLNIAHNHSKKDSGSVRAHVQTAKSQEDTRFQISRPCCRKKSRRRKWLCSCTPQSFPITMSMLIYCFMQDRSHSGGFWKEECRWREGKGESMPVISRNLSTDCLTPR